MAVPVLVYVALAAYLIHCFRIYRRHSRQYGHIPAVGSDNIVSSFITAIRFLYKADVVFEQGYRQYKGRIFRIPQLTGWFVCVSGDQLVEELRKAPENVLSGVAAQDDFSQNEYTMGPMLRETTIHVDIVRTALNRNLNKLLPQVIDEISVAFSKDLGSKLLEGSDWTPVRVTSVILRIVFRATARSFVGLPVCRLDEYHRATVQFTTNVVAGGVFINLFPEFLKPLVGRLISRIRGPQNTVLKYLAPIIEDRKVSRAKDGFDYPGKPNDLLQWLMDAAAPKYYESNSDLSLRTLAVTFAAIHTTSLTLTNAIYDLAAYSQYAAPLRQEIIDHMGPDTSMWTKEALERCWKLDSFFKESVRMHSITPMVLLRKVLRDYTFSDGTTIPAGATISTTSLAMHHDPKHYADPHTFDGFRFSSIREKMQRDESAKDLGDEKGSHLRFTGTDRHYIVFGGGRHVCPGRFFAAMQVKCALAYLLLNYDIKMCQEGVRPPDVRFGLYATANRNTEVMFRRREKVVA